MHDKDQELTVEKEEPVPAADSPAEETAETSTQEPVSELTKDDDLPQEEISEDDAPLEEETSGDDVTDQEEFSSDETLDDDLLSLDDLLAAAKTLCEAEGDTLRLDDIFPLDEEDDSDTLNDATVRFGEISDAAEKSDNSEAVQEDAEQEPGQPVEPFSEEWEPDYDQPMGEYIPSAPIVFHPKSRLQELKRQLVSGPEKRYYDLAEQGVGKLQIAIFLSLIVFLLSAGGTILYAAGMVPENRMRLVVFSQIFGMLLSGLLGCYQMLDGIVSMLKGKFTLNTLLFVTFIACCVDGVYCLLEMRVPICAAFSLEMFMSLWNCYHKRSTEMAMMDTMRKATHLDSLVKSDNFYENKSGILRSEGNVEDFMDNYAVPSKPEKAQNRFALIALLVSIAIACVAGVLHGPSMGVQIFTTSLLVAVPASSFVALSRPMAVLERRFHALGTVLCGWQGVEGLCDASVFPLTDADIFPAGSAKMNGVKFYGDRDPDEIISYTAALISANGDGLAPIFEQLLKNRNATKYIAENMQYYPNGGIGGEVCGEPVLIGTLSFLQEMGVEIPEGTMVNQAVYTAIDGTLCGLYAISYNRMKSAVVGLTTISSCRKLTPVMVSGDFMLTESFLKNKFGISTKRLAFPPRPVRQELAAVKPSPDAKALAMVTQEGLAAVAYAVTGARALRRSSKLGLIVHMAGGVVGMLIMLALAVLGSVELLTPINILLYQLVWMIPGILFTEWTRAI